MNNLKNQLIDYFSKRIYELYDVTRNHARFLFDRWDIIRFDNNKEVEEFLISNDVYKVFFIRPNINIVKKYSKENLRTLGINLSVEVDKNARIYKDDTYQFLWQELFHGMGDCYTGLFTIKDSLPQDQHLLKSSADELNINKNEK